MADPKSENAMVKGTGYDEPLLPPAGDRDPEDGAVRAVVSPEIVTIAYSIKTGVASMCSAGWVQPGAPA